MIALATTRDLKLNKTEERYRQVLESRYMAGDIRSYGVQRITLKLADDCRYTPDFDVVLNNFELELHEVKGFFRDDARVKIKVAAAQFPYRFKLVRWVNKQFQIEEVK